MCDSASWVSAPLQGERSSPMQERMLAWRLGGEGPSRLSSAQGDGLLKPAQLEQFLVARGYGTRQQGLDRSLPGGR